MDLIIDHFDNVYMLASKMSHLHSNERGIQVRSEGYFRFAGGSVGGPIWVWTPAGHADRRYEQVLPRTRSLFNMIMMMLTISAIRSGVGSTFFEY